MKDLCVQSPSEMFLACYPPQHCRDLETLSDVTTLRQEVEVLQQREEHFRSLIEHTSDIVTILNKDCTILYESPSIERLLGYEPEELVGKGIAGFVHPDDLPAVSSSFSSVMRSPGIPHPVQLRWRHKDGSWRICEAIAKNLLEDPIIAGIVVNFRDITERKHLESQLAFAQKMESIGQLAAGIAHEINTPMQYIGDNTRFLQDAFGEVETLLKSYKRLAEVSKTRGVPADLVADVEAVLAAADIDYLTEEIPRALQQSLEGIDRVTTIVRAMKEFSHPGIEEKVETDLNRAIETTITVARNEWKYVAEMVTDFDRTLPPVPCLPGEFNQVILNLIINAVHAIVDVVKDGANGKGTITVSTRRDGEWVEIRLRDTGTGIPEAIRLKIFDPFFTTKGVGKGTGQGLAIAHAVIVKKHKGTITCETEVGQGTTFILRLPLASASPRGMESSNEKTHSLC